MWCNVDQIFNYTKKFQTLFLSLPNDPLLTGGVRVSLVILFRPEIQEHVEQGLCAVELCRALT
jgi:hypothetical protein